MKLLTLASEILIDNISSLYQSPRFEGIRGSGKLHTSDRLQDLLHAFTYRIRRDYCKLCTRTCMLMGFFRPLPGIFAEVLSFKSTSWSHFCRHLVCAERASSISCVVEAFLRLPKPTPTAVVGEATAMSRLVHRWDPRQTSWLQVTT